MKHLKAKQYATARTHLAKGGRGRAADLTATLIAAWAYAGSGDGKKALETVDRLKGERAYTVFRDYHAGLIAETVGNQAEAEKRLKTAYEAERNTLRIVDAYARLQSRRGQKEAALATYTGFEAVLPRHPIVRDAVEQLKSGRTLPPLVGTRRRRAPPRCSTGSAPPATARATSCRRSSICASRSTSTRTTRSPSSRSPTSSSA